MSSREVKKQIYIFGGGGEPDGEKTIFDESLDELGSFVKKSDWEVSLSFNGGHKRTEKIINSNLSKAKNVGSFTKENYELLVNEMIQKIESGELQAGDQLAVTIDSHGGKNDSKDKTHQVSLANGQATNLNTLEGSQMVSLDRLEVLAKLASEKGVKLAIIDTSCFSGNLLNIYNDKVCLISGTGPNQYGYSGTFQFNAKFYDRFKKGKNLEQIFLDARKGGDAADFPMISTPEGRYINDLLYTYISSFLSYNDKISDNFKEQYTTNKSSSFENQVCMLDHANNQINNLLKEYEAIGNITKNISKSDLAPLKKALEAYRKYQKQYENSLREAFGAEAEIKSMLNNKFSADEKVWKDYVPMDFITAKFDAQIAAYQKMLDKETVESSKVHWNEYIARFKKQKEISQYVKDNLSVSAKNKMKQHEEMYEQSRKDTKGTWDLARAVGLEAKKVYDALYREAQSPKSNPCRDFVL